MHNDYTSGNLLKQLMSFSLPYMLACFLQTFYGMADLFIAGQFNGADTVSAVSIGSQVMHMLTVVLVGLAMGTTVMISRSLGAKDTKKIAGYIESVNIDFGDGIKKDFLAKLDTGNSTKASCLEVGEYTEKGKNITFTIDGKKLTFKKVGETKAVAGEKTYVRPIIIVPELTLGLRKLKNVPISIVKHRDNKTTNLLVNRDTMSKLGYVINPNVAHVLTNEMEKVKII